MMITTEDSKTELHSPQMVTTFFQQFLVLYQRNIINLRRDPLALRLQFVQLMAAGLFIGVIFLRLDWSQESIQSRLGILGFMSLGYAFGQIISVAQKFPSQRAIYLRDRSSQLYYTLSYYLAMAFSEFPIQVLLPVIQICIVYWMTNLNNNPTRFLLTTLFSTLFFQVCIAGGIAISAAVSNAAVALAIGPLVAIIWILFAGYFVNFGNIPIFLKWIIWISPVRYAFESYVWLQFDGVTFTCTDAQRLPDGTCPISTGNQVLQNLQFEDADLYLNGGILVLMLIGFHCLGCLFLKLRDKRNQQTK